MKLPDDQIKKNIPAKHSLVTRRDFLSHGLIAGAGWAMMPTALTILSQKVLAQEVSCSVRTGSNMLPVICVDLAGGAHLGADFLVGANFSQSNILSGSNAYSAWGFAPETRYSSSITPDNTFGVLMHPASAFLNGMKSVISNPEHQSKIDGFIIPCASNDDSSNNAFGASHLLSLVGRTGAIKNILGTSNTQAGGRHAIVGGSFRPEWTPVQIASTDSISAVTGASGLKSEFDQAFRYLNQSDNRTSTAKHERVLRAISHMSEGKINEFRNLAWTDQMRALLGCFYNESVELPRKFPETSLFPSDVNDDLGLKVIFQNQADSRLAGFEIDQTLAVNGQDQNLGNQLNSATAAISRLVVHPLADETGPLGNAAGVGVIELGNFDNHNSTAITSYLDRMRAGMNVGRILKYMLATGQGGAVLVCTDGAMGTTGRFETIRVLNNGTEIASGNFAQHPGDAGAFSIQAMFVCHPNATRGSLVSNAGRQVGSVSEAGVDRQALITSNSPENAAMCMVYNYLALHFEGDELNQKAGLMNSRGSNIFSGANESRYRIFRKIGA